MGSVKSWFGGEGSSSGSASRAAAQEEAAVAEKVNVDDKLAGKVASKKLKKATQLGGGDSTFDGGVLG